MMFKLCMFVAAVLIIILGYTVVSCLLTIYRDMNEMRSVIEDLNEKVEILSRLGDD